VYPEPTVRALILNPQGAFFLCQSHKWNQAWVIPGGHIELGESAEAAVYREVKEETGLEVHSARFLCYQESLYTPVFYQKKHFIFLDFLCHTHSSERDCNVVLNEEAEDWRWVSFSEINDFSIDPFTRKTIQVYLQALKQV
jgi:nucleoside triphosphatase